MIELPKLKMIVVRNADGFDRSLCGSPGCEEGWFGYIAKVVPAPGVAGGGFEAPRVHLLDPGWTREAHPRFNVLWRLKRARRWRARPFMGVQVEAGPFVYTVHPDEPFECPKCRRVQVLPPAAVTPISPAAMAMLGAHRVEVSRIRALDEAP
jgi:hypothetical protein